MRLPKLAWSGDNSSNFYTSSNFPLFLRGLLISLCFLVSKWEKRSRTDHQRFWCRYLQICRVIQYVPGIARAHFYLGDIEAQFKRYTLQTQHCSIELSQLMKRVIYEVCSPSWNVEVGMHCDSKEWLLTNFLTQQNVLNLMLYSWWGCALRSHV